MSYFVSGRLQVNDYTRLTQRKTEKLFGSRYLVFANKARNKVIIYYYYPFIQRKGQHKRLKACTRCHGELTRYISTYYINLLRISDVFPVCMFFVYVCCSGAEERLVRAPESKILMNE